MAKYKYDSDTMIKMFEEEWSEKDLEKAVANMMNTQQVVFDDILYLAGYIYYDSPKSLNLVELENKITDLAKEYKKSYAIMPPELFVDNATFPSKLANFDYSITTGYYCIPVVEDAYQDNKIPNINIGKLHELAHLSDTCWDIFENFLQKSLDN